MTFKEFLNEKTSRMVKVKYTSSDLKRWIKNFETSDDFKADLKEEGFNSAQIQYIEDLVKSSI